jgi:hypothetical protein
MVTFYLQVKHQPPPMLALIVGDCISNLRGALDHSMFAVRRSPGTPQKWKRDSQFPICKDRAQFQAEQKRYAGVSSAARQILERLQPYSGGQDPKQNPLYQLQQLSNTDKHRTVIFTAVPPVKTSLAVPRPRSGTVRAELVATAVNDGDVIGKLYYSDPVPKGTQITVKLDRGVTIEDLQPPIGVNAALERMADAVENAIVKLSSLA